MSVLVALALVPTQFSPSASLAPLPSVQLVVPQHLTQGQPLHVSLIGHDSAAVGAFEASIRVDPAIAEFSGLQTGTSLPDGTPVTPLGTVQTPHGLDIGAYACTGAGCPRPGPATPAAKATSTLATVDFAVTHAGVLGLVVDNAVVTDSSGRVLRRFGPMKASVAVGRDRTVFPAPSAAPAPRVTPPAEAGRHPFDVTGDGHVNTADIAESAHAWTLAREGAAGPCAALAEPIADVNRDGCMDIADVQAVAANVGLSYQAAGPTVDGRQVRLAAASPVTFTVNSTGDLPDAVGDRICQTSTPGECTLRAALQESNQAQGPVTIAFNLPRPPAPDIPKISPASQWPSLNNAFGVTIDGYTQPGSSPNTDPLIDNAVPGVELIGQGPSGLDGFFVGTSNNTIRGLDLHNFQRAVWLYGPNAGSNIVVGNILGLLPTGDFDPHTFLYRNSSCVVIQGGAHDNIVGRPNVADRNTISGCAHQGIASYDNLTTRNTYQNNIVGLSPDGTQRRGNQSHGIDINTWSTYTTVGGTGPMQRNVLSGNYQEGVEISHGQGTLYNNIIGNYIGTDVTGNNAPAFAQDGQWGVHLEGFANCNNAACPLDAGNTTVSNNVIVDAQEGGVMIDKGFHDTVVTNNLIGQTLNGTPAGNKFFGVRIEAGSTRITLAGNVISNNETGVQIQAIGVEPPDATPTVTRFNKITGNIMNNSASGNPDIDLAPLNAVNANGSGDPNVNEGVSVAILTAPNAATVLASTCPGCAVELFQANRAVGSYGGSAAFLAGATADSAGRAVVFVPPAGFGQVVTATATTPGGSTSEFARNITTPVPNPADVGPTASFTVACAHLTCTTDASASVDPDGTLVRYQWNWGDGTTTEGATSSHAYASPGSPAISLTVTDNDGNTGQTTQIGTAVNLSPTAGFNSNCVYQRCTFDGSASSDADGTVAKWAWDFGDGTTAVNAAASHQYATGGTYNVTLTVTDNDGATGLTTRPLTVVALPANSIVSDSFLRTVTGGWGSADVGGTWSYGSGMAPSFSVNGQAGVIQVSGPVTSRFAFAPSVNERSVDLFADVGTVQAPTSSYGQTAAVVGRRVALNTEYRARARFTPAGGVYLAIVKMTGTAAETVIGTEVAAGLAYSPGAMFTIHFQISGNSPSSLKARVWAAGQPEPTGWNVSVTDSEASLQASGAAGVQAYLGAGTTNAPVSFLVDNVSFRYINLPPAASFAPTCTNRSCSFNGTASSDSDGTVASWAWDFGDGTTGSGSTAGHLYGAFGQYTVQLTVTDNRGATASTSQVVTVANAPPVASFVMSCNGQSCTADGTASTDPDGSITSYAWDFGDGNAANGPTASNTYAQPDIYTVALTVTDTDGATSTSTQTINVLGPNTPPVASFTVSCSVLTCSVDGTASYDPDGSVVGYQWNFGDGATSGTPTAGHTYAATGADTITLTVTDNRGANSSTSQIVNVLGPNIAPTAVVATSCSALSCTFDGSRSTDSDGQVVSYAWDFGDGTTQTSAPSTVTHTYALSGTYPVTLTVTDDRGGTGTAKATVAPMIAPAPVSYASDTFGRTVTSGWGNADSGGAYNVGKAPTSYSVANGAGQIRIVAAAGNGVARLLGVSARDVDETVTITPDKAATGGVGVWASLLARRSGTNEYRVRARLAPNGSIYLAVEYILNNGSENFIGPEVQVAGISYTPGSSYTLRFQVYGASPTTLQARLWPSGGTEPAAWTVVQTDSQATLQGAGSPGVVAVVSGASTNLPVTWSFANFSVRPFDSPPVASFTAGCTDLTCSVNASASTDAQGPISSYQWSFGDGATASGVTASHAYGTGGTYVITLTVTDSAGQQTVMSSSVPVTNPNIAPIAVISKTCTYLTCTFDGTGSHDPDGTVVSYAWDFGDGTQATGATASHPYSTTGTYTVVLTVTDDRGGTNATSSTVSVATNVPPTASASGSCSFLVCSFDATASSDPDDTISSYSWDFGDLTTGSGATVPHTYAAPGTYTATVTVTDSAGASSTYSLTVTAPTPVASAFTASCPQLTCSFDGSGSTANGGTVQQWAWDFGDGTQGTGTTTSHAYAVAGTYTATLTVTDNRGVAAAATHQVTPTPPPNPIYGSDSFARTTSAGWGTADSGGPWTMSGNGSSQVTGTAATLTIAGAGGNQGGRLLGVSTTDSDVSFRVSTNKVATGFGQWASVVGRRVVTNTEYRMRLRFGGDGKLYLGAIRIVGSSGEVLIGTEVQVAATVTAGAFYWIRADVTGTTPTTLRGRAWADGQPEPTTWAVNASDSTSSLQSAGSVGVVSYVAGTSTSAPVTFTVQSFLARPTNVPPVASFTTVCTSLACNADGSASSDFEGPVARWSWSFGDGAVASGALASHTYTAAGTYTVSLTVTDSAGMTSFVTHQVTVAA